MFMKAGNILKLAGPNYIDRLPEHLRDGAIETLNKVHSAADKFNEELAANEANVNLSEEGRVGGGKAVAAKAFGRLNAVEATVKTLTDRATSLEKTLLARVVPTPPKDPADRVGYEFQVRETRDQLRGLSADERLNIFRTTDDPAMLAAFEGAPMTLGKERPDGSRRMEHFISPEGRRAVTVERAERMDPAAAQTLREVQALRDVYRTAVAGVRKEILDEVPDAAEREAITIVR
jgi:hypothetical protein